MDPYRLPTTVVPSRYELTLAPDLEAFTFAGEERIHVQVREPVTEVVLNAIELDIRSAEIVAEDGRRLGATVALDEETERATLALEGTAEPGAWVLHITFCGTLNDKLHGFYRSTFTDGDGVERVIATTQFEATDARRAFPCWDEPSSKAVFSVTLLVDEDLLAVSNSTVIEEIALANGKREVRFADTMVMSSYLVAFVVGPLVATDPVDVDGVPLRVVAPAHRIGLAHFALEVGAAALRYYARWFGIVYPGDKLDLVAIPDFAFGAMENLGCVTFRETALLVDPKVAGRLDLQRVTDVVNHEIAHMWFGDLVTMKWWNGIWLNEAFATFMEIMATDAFRPEWERWVSFSLERGAAFTVDSLQATRPVEFPVSAPAEADGMFDVLTYQKGGAVLRMLEQYLGEERFRDGIRLYLGAHAYGNAETTDLWDAIEEATGEPVRATMDSWIFQGGYPVIEVSASTDLTTLTLRQERFCYVPAEASALYEVPILVRVGVGGTVEVHRLLLADRSATLELSAKADWVVVNAGAAGFYRTRYSTDLLQTLIVHRDEAALAPLERHALASDAWAAVRAGLAPVTDFLETCLFLADDDDPNVWSAVLGGLEGLNGIVADEDRPVLAAFVRRVAGPALERFGWEPLPGEPETAGAARARLVASLGGVGADTAVREHCMALLDAYLAERSSVPADLVGAIVNVVAQRADAATYERLADRFRQPGDPHEEQRFLYALAAVEDPDLLARTLDLTVSGEVRTQNAPYVIATALANRRGGAQAWRFTQQHWDDLLSRFPANSIPRMLQGLGSQSEPSLVHDVKGFLAEHPVPQGAKQVEQTLELLDVNAGFRQREAPSLGRSLSVL